jgi:CHAT domain-containing protein/tetratricopeptide (TPR) repeat protein
MARNDQLAIPPGFEDQTEELIGLARKAQRDPRVRIQQVAVLQEMLSRLPRDRSPFRGAMLTDLGLVYTLLPVGDRTQNLRQAIAAYTEALNVFTPDAHPVAYANLQNNLGDTYYELPTGNRGENLTRAINAYEEALRFRIREDAPSDYARTQRRLGMAYADLPTGDRPANLRSAIHAYETALSVGRANTAPDDYAKTLELLGLAYGELTTGDGAVNRQCEIAAYTEALLIWTLDFAPLQYATTKLNLGVAYSELPTGDRAWNLNQAIACFRDASQVLTADTHPGDFVSLQRSIGNLYLALPAGNRDANLNQAIVAYRSALRLLTRDTSLTEYAATQSSLGRAYADLLAGNRDDNLRAAIACFEDVLSIWTVDSNPQGYAHTQNALSIAYIQLPTGDQGENLKAAITACHEALRFLTAETAPLAYAAVQVNLAHAYRHVFTGDRVENLGRALTSYQEALRFTAAETAPRQYASAQVGIGSVYAELPTGNRAENLQRAIVCYQKALDLVSPETAPADYAKIQQNLGMLFYEALPAANRATNLNQAIAHFTEALRVWTSDVAPFDYALTQANLGRAYAGLEIGDRTENFTEAISRFKEALRFLTPDAAPFEYSRIQTDLGNALAKFPTGDRAANLQQALAAFGEALRFRTLEADPRGFAATQTDVGNLHFGERDWAPAEAAYAKAVRAKDSLYHTASTEMARHAVLAEAANLFSNNAYCLGRLRRFNEAVERLEAGKARALAQSLNLTDAVLRQVDPANRVALETVRDRIRALEAEARFNGPQRPNAGETSEFLQISGDLRTARLDLAHTAKRIQARFPQFMPDSLDFASIVEAATADRPLTYLLTTPQGSLGLIVPADVVALDDEHCVWLDDFQSQDLADLFMRRRTVKVGPGERASVSFRGSYDGAETGEYLDTWLDLMFPLLCERLVGPLASRLVELGYRQAALIPCGRLSLLPLSAGALHQVAITVAPSARAMLSARQAILERSGQSAVLLGVGNPLPHPQPLAFSRLELEGIAALFPSTDRRLLYEREATVAGIRANLAGATHLHFSCHAAFNDYEPLNSALFLSGDDELNLGDLLDGKLNVSTLRLAVLAACQTGISDFLRVPDEAVGFPAGILQAGVPGVVSSLWPVVDISTALLLTRFYLHHKEEGWEPAKALNMAQVWLRDVSAGELAERFSELRRLKNGPDIPYEQLSAAWRRFSAAKPSTKPFAHPRYWAAFTFSGA